MKHARNIKITIINHGGEYRKVDLIKIKTIQTYKLRVVYSKNGLNRIQS